MDKKYNHDIILNGCWVVAPMQVGEESPNIQMSLQQLHRDIKGSR